MLKAKDPPGKAYELAEDAQECGEAAYLEELYGLPEGALKKLK